MTPTPQAKKIARDFLASFQRPSHIHSGAQGMLKSLWKQTGGIRFGDLEAKLKGLHGNLEDAHHKKEQAYVKAHSDDKFPADDFNESKDGLKLRGEIEYVDWAQDLVGRLQKGLGEFKDEFSTLGAI